MEEKKRKKKSFIFLGRYCCRDLTVQGSSNLAKSIDGDYQAKIQVQEAAQSHLAFVHEEQVATLFYK